MYPSERSSAIDSSKPGLSRKPAPHVEAAPDIIVEGPPFGPRLRRAIILLVSALGVHLWVVRAPVIKAGLAHLPSVAAPEFVRSGLAAGSSASPGLSTATAPRPVHVRTEFITARENPGEAIVGTSGMRLAKGAFTNKPAVETASAKTSLDESRLGSRLPETSATEAPAAPEETPAPAPARVSSGTPAERPASTGAPVLAERSVAADTPAPAVVSSALELRHQEDSVRGVLLDYTRAFERLDVQAAKAIWHSVDDRALQRAFQQLDGQKLHFASCGVSVSGRDANARCRGDATYRPKVGSRVLRLTEREWTFSLSRDNDRWQIVNATLQ